MIETHVKPGTLELQSRLLDDCAELTEQVEKQSERLVELKAKRDANPGTSLAFPSRRVTDELRQIISSDYSIRIQRLITSRCSLTEHQTLELPSRDILLPSRRWREPSDHRSSFLSFSKWQPTRFSTNRQTSKSKRRAGLKKASGKKGTIYEESYLLNSMKKAVEVRLLEIESTSRSSSRLVRRD